MEKERNMQLQSLCFGMILFSFLTQTLHAKTRLSNSINTAPTLDVDQVLKRKLRIGFPKPNGYENFLHMERDNTTNDTIVTGYCIDVFLAAIQGLQIEVNFIPFVDENENSSGTYNDLLYQIYLGKFDAVVGDVTITANRSKYVDFTVPYTDIGVGTIAKRVDQNDFWIFLRLFNTNLWLTSFGFFMFTGFIVSAVEHPSNPDIQGSPSQQIGTIFWFAFSTLVFSHKEKLTSNLSKFVVVVWVFVVLILTSSYTALLTSMLIVEQIRLTTLAGYIGTIGYHDDALSRGSKNGGAVAIIDEIPYLKLFLAMYPDSYTLVKSTPITNGFGFAFEKGSLLVSIISKEIVKLREDGELIKIEEKWFKSKSTLVNEPDSDNKSPETLDVHRFRGLFLITGFSSILALAIFLFYRLYNFFVKLVDSYIYIVLGDELLPNREVTRRVNL